MATFVSEQNQTQFQLLPEYSEWAPTTDTATNIVSPREMKELQDLEEIYAEESITPQHEVETPAPTGLHTLTGTIRSTHYGGDSRAIIYTPELREPQPSHVMESLHRQAFAEFMDQQGYGND